MKSPTYFLAVFGDPKPPKKDRIESGIYHPDPRFYPFPIEPGDVLMLYCTGGYVEYSMRVPGIGIVLGSNDNEIHYRYLPLLEPISMDRINSEFEPKDSEKFSNRRFSSFWLFEISRESFLKAIGHRLIDWP